MSVHVVIKRRFQLSKPEELVPLLKELSSRAKKQKGYVSTEILQSLENTEDYLVVSVWETAEDWKKWFLSGERKTIQDQVDSLIGERTFYEVFEPLS